MISIQKNLVERAAYTTTKVTVEQKRSGLFAPKIKPDPIRDSLKSLEQIREMGDSIPAALNMVTTGADALKHATILANLAKTTNPAAELTNILLSRYITGPSFGSSRLKSVTIETKPLKSHIEVGILRISNDKTHMEGIWNVDKASIEANELTIQAPKRTVFQEVKSSGMRVLLSAAALFSSAFLSTNPALAFVPSVDFQKGQSITTQELFEPAELNANELFIRIGDGLFSGSQIRAKALEMIVEKNLKIETLAEVFKSEMKDQKVGIGLGSLFAEASKGDVPFNFLSPKLAAIPTFSISSAETLIHSFDRAAELIGQHKFYLKVGELLHTVSAEIGLKPVGYSVPSIVEVLKAERIMKEDLKTFEQTKKHTFNPCVGELLAAANSVNDLAEIRAKFAVEKFEEGASMQQVIEESQALEQVLEQKEVKESYEKLKASEQKLQAAAEKIAKLEAARDQQIAEPKLQQQKPQQPELGKFIQTSYQTVEMENAVKEYNSIARTCLIGLTNMREYLQNLAQQHPQLAKYAGYVMEGIEYGAATAFYTSIAVGLIATAPVSIPTALCVGAHATAKKLCKNTLIDLAQEKLIEYAKSQALNAKEATKFSETTEWIVGKFKNTLYIKKIGKIALNPRSVMSEIRSAALSANIGFTSGKWAQNRNAEKLYDILSALGETQ